MIDYYAKAVLTVIAVALIAISVKLWTPRTAQAAMERGSVTMGQLMDSTQLSDADRQKLVAELPVVVVWKILSK